MNQEEPNTPQNLWAPWRMNYIKSHVEPNVATQKDSAGNKTENKCFMCQAGEVIANPATNEYDALANDMFVLQNDYRGILMLNRYPYTNGHLLVFGKRHIADLIDHTPEERGHLMALTALGEQLLQTAINPQGFNIGINLGRAAGAGVPGHMHMHIVPRWQGDVNFMSTVGYARVIPQAIEESFQHLKETLIKMHEAELV